MKTLRDWAGKKVQAFVQCQSGAVTVDWVALTAIVIGMVMALFVILDQSIFENVAVAIVAGIDASVNNF